MYNFCRAFKKARVYFKVLNAKTQMQKDFKLKSGYKAFKSFQTTVSLKQIPQLCLYKIAL